MLAARAAMLRAVAELARREAQLPSLSLEAFLADALEPDDLPVFTREATFDGIEGNQGRLTAELAERALRALPPVRRFER